MKRINLIRHSWSYTAQDGEDYYEEALGVGGIVDISEVHGTTSKPYHVIVSYSDGRTEEIFNPSLIQFVDDKN